MTDNYLAKFTCSKCDGHELTVTHIWSIQAGNDSERWREWGPLTDDHHWQYEFKERIEKNPDDEVDRGDRGEFKVGELKVAQHVQGKIGRGKRHCKIDGAEEKNELGEVRFR